MSEGLGGFDDLGRGNIFSVTHGCPQGAILGGQRVGLAGNFGRVLRAAGNMVKEAATKARAKVYRNLSIVVGRAVSVYEMVNHYRDGPRLTNLS